MYSCHFNHENQRWQGSYVVGECDYNGCHEDVTRSFEFACGCSCRLFYCYEHLGFRHDRNSVEAKPDSEEWLLKVVTAEEFEEFRLEYPELVNYYKEELDL